MASPITLRKSIKQIIKKIKSLAIINSQNKLHRPGHEYNLQSPNKPKEYHPNKVEKFL